MKIPITDQFLLDMYQFFSDVKNARQELLPTPSEMKARLRGYSNPVLEKYRREKNQRSFTKFIYYLKRNNYITVKNLEGKAAVMLTAKGIEKALKASFKSATHQKRKDGKWIMIIFDIPKKQGKSRGLLRSILQNLGYKMYQQSVWVTPYDVSEKTERSLQAFSLDPFVKIFLIEKL